MSLCVTVCVEPQSKQVSAEGPESSGGGGDGQLYVVLGALPQVAAVLVRHLHSGALWVQLRLHLLGLLYQLLSLALQLQLQLCSPVLCETSCTPCG